MSSDTMNDAAKKKYYGPVDLKIEETEISSASTGTTKSLNFKLVQTVKLSKTYYHAIVSLIAADTGVDYNVKSGTIFNIVHEGVKLRAVAINDFVGGELIESDGNFIQRIKSHYDSLSGGTARGILSTLNELKSIDKNRVLSTKLDHSSSKTLNIYINQLTSAPLKVIKKEIIKSLGGGRKTIIQLDLDGLSMLPPGKLLSDSDKDPIDPNDTLSKGKGGVNGINSKKDAVYFAKNIKIGNVVESYKYLKTKEERIKLNKDACIKNSKGVSASDRGIYIEGLPDGSTAIINHDNGVLSITTLDKSSIKITIVYHLIARDELYTEVHKNLYGDTRDLDAYPGVLALGSNADIHTAIDKNIELEIKTNLLDGYNEFNLNTIIRSDVSNFVNSLKIGESLVISQLEAKILSITGVRDVKVVSVLDGEKSEENIKAEAYEVIKINNESIELQGLNV